MVITAALGAAVGSAFGPAAAQSPPVSARSRPVVPTPAVLDSAFAAELSRMPGTHIDLEEAMRLALDNSTEAQRARAQLAAAEAVVKRERGAFDPALFATGTRISEELPTSSPFAPVTSNDRLEGTAGAGIKLTTGTEVEATAFSQRQTTHAGFESLSPKYDSNAGVSVRQPLLKGFGIAARGELTAAEHELVAARADYEDIRLAVRSQVEQLYWDLYAAERDVAVESVIRDAAAGLLESAERRARVGLVGPNQVANAQVFLADREASLLDRIEARDEVSDRLASTIGQRPPDPAAPRYRPTADPPLDYDLATQDSVVALAQRVNYTLLGIDARIEALAARERAAGRDALPQLDLVGSVAGNGLSGKGRDLTFGDTVIPNDQDTDFGESWKQVFNGDFPAWTAGLRFSMPIGRRAGLGERDLRRAELALGEQQRVEASRALDEAVRARHRELEHAQARLQFAKNGADAAFEQSRIGRLEFENGRTTAFELVRLAGDLASAQQRYSQALVRAAKAAAQLRELTAGTYPASPAP